MSHGNPKGSPENQELLHQLGRTVRMLREEQSLSRSTLAERTGLSARFIAQLESGQGNISVANLAQIARTLEVPLASLLEPTAPTPTWASDQLRYRISRRLAGAPLITLRKVKNILDQEDEKAEGNRSLVTLLGLRGAGKSTVGPLLAKRLSLEFLELDEMIHKQTGLALPEIFEMHGEKYYRKAERNALEHLLQENKPLVIAVSGGIVGDKDSFRLLQENTRMIWLRTTPEQHMGRVTEQGDQRPMENRPNAMIELRQLLDMREPFYGQAEVVVDTNDKSAEECSSILAAALSKDYQQMVDAVGIINQG